MGWKAIKDYYNIEHIVHVRRDGCIGIGSTYVLDLIVVDPDGEIIDDSMVRQDHTLLYGYTNKIKTDPEKFRQLYQQVDIFSASTPCYTYDIINGLIVEKQFDPTIKSSIFVTHDGCLMFENTYSTDRSKVIQRAIADAKAGMTSSARQRQRLEEQLQEVDAEMEMYQRALEGFENEGSP